MTESEKVELEKLKSIIDLMYKKQTLMRYGRETNYDGKLLHDSLRHEGIWNWNLINEALGDVLSEKVEESFGNVQYRLIEDIGALLKNSAISRPVQPNSAGYLFQIFSNRLSKFQDGLENKNQKQAHEIILL